MSVIPFHDDLVVLMGLEPRLPDCTDFKLLNYNTVP